MNNDWILIDTCIVSYVMRDSPIGRKYQKHLENKKHAISFITVGEMYYGAKKANWGNRKIVQLESELKKFTLIPYNKEIAKKWGFIVAKCDKIGHQIAHNDAWIAACCLYFKIPLITHNLSDFQNVDGLNIISENST